MTESIVPFQQIADYQYAQNPNKRLVSRTGHFNFYQEGISWYDNISRQIWRIRSQDSYSRGYVVITILEGGVLFVLLFGEYVLLLF